MKNIIYSLMALFMLGVASSCAGDADDMDGNSFVTVKISTVMNGVSNGRAISDGATVNKVKMMVYDVDGNVLSEMTDTAEVTEEGISGFALRLVSNRQYSVAFFAYNEAQRCYNIDDLKSVKVSYEGMAGNDENRDAFIYGETFVARSNTEEMVTLSRPFAQINAIAKDLDAFLSGGKTLPVFVNMSVEGVASELNCITGKVTNPETTLVAQIVSTKPIPSTESVVAGNITYTNGAWLSMNYVLVPTKALVNCKMVINDASGNKLRMVNVPNLPTEANFRTNIVGNLLTEESQDVDVVMAP